MPIETKLAAALDLARAGFAVFPLTPDAKTPAISNWQNLATTHEDTIARWWTEWPQANIGLPTLNHVVIDIDPRNGGRESFELLTLSEEFPKTARAQTQSGGDHIYYALPPHTVVKGGTNKLGPGVDIKSWGGYVVAPGSSIGGRAYAWANDRPVAPAPTWLIERCKAHKPRSDNAGKRLVEEDEQAIALAQAWLDKQSPEAHLGAIDDTAFKVAARLYDFGISLETAIALLTEWSETRAFPPMQADRIATIAESAGRNRDNAIGSRHPNASGFAPYDIPEYAKPLAAAVDAVARRTLFFMTFKDAAARALSHGAEPLIEGVIDCGAMSTVYGESNSGKSFQEMDKDFHIAIGAPWAGRAVKQGAVVWVAAEGGAGVYKRLAALQLHYQREDAPFFLVPCPVNLLRPDADIGPLITLIKEIEAKCGQPVVKVTLDTLSRVIAGGDENSSVDMGLLVHHFDAIREHTGAHLAVIHHTGKDKARGARGHSLLRAATDTEIEIDNHTITVTKQRDLEGDTQLRFKLMPLRVGADVRGRDVTSCYVEIGVHGDAVDVRMTRSESELLEQIDEALARSTKKDFDWLWVQENCRKKESEKVRSRSTIIELLSGLLEKGHLAKPFDNQYVRTILDDFRQFPTEA